MQWFPSNEDVKYGYPLKRRHFAVNGSYSVETVDDMYRNAALTLVTGFLDLSTSMTLNDLEPPPRKRGEVNKLLQFLDAAHISTLNCDEMAEDRPRQPVYENLNHSVAMVFLDSLRRPTLLLRGKITPRCMSSFCAS